MKKERTLTIWDILLYLGAFIILIWALLKALGVIHTPIWVDMLPYFGGGASLIGGAYKLGKIKNGIEETQRKVDSLLEFERRFRKVEHEHNLCMEGKLNVHKKFGNSNTFQ